MVSRLCYFPSAKGSYISFYNIHNNPKYTIIIFRPASWFRIRITFVYLRHKNGIYTLNLRRMCLILVLYTQGVKILTFSVKFWKA